MNLSSSYMDDCFTLNYTNLTGNSTIHEYITFRQPSYGTTEHVIDEYNNIVVIYLLAVIMIGVVGNLFVLCVITSNRKLHRPPFYYIVYVALTDLCKSVFCLPFVLSVVTQLQQTTQREAGAQIWEYGQNLCDATSVASLLFSFASLSGHLVAIVDRYTAMKAPSFYSMCSNTAVGVTIIVFCTGIAFCFSFPPILNDDAFVFKEEELQCTFNHKNINKDVVRGYCISFIIILLTLLNLHCRIFMFLRAHRKMAPLEHQPARSDNWTFFGPGANRQGLINVMNGFTGGPPAPFANAVQGFSHVGRVVHLRVTRCQHIPRTLFIVSLMLFIVWIPYLFQVLVNSYLERALFSRKFVVVITLLSHSHVALSALVWLLTGSPLRKTIVNSLRKLRHQIYARTFVTPPIQEESFRNVNFET